MPAGMATGVANNRETIEMQETNTPPAPEEESEYPSGFRLIMITVGLALSIFLAALDSTIIAIAIPSLTTQFGSIANIAWYGSAYNITNSSFQSSWGRAYRYFPLKRTYMLAICIFELGNVVAGAASTSNAVILGRIVAGIGGGGIMTGSFIIIALSAKPRYRSAYMGVLGATFGCASVAGPLMGGSLTEKLSWRWCFWINLPIGAIAAGTILFGLSQPQQATPLQATLKHKLFNMDLNGSILVAGSLSCFVLSMHFAGIMSWSSTPVVASLVGFASLAALFALNERLMSSKAMIQPHLLKRRNIMMNSVFSFFLAGLYFPLLYSLPIQFQSVDNDSAAESGIRVIPLVLGISVFTMVSNAMLTWWRHYTPFLLVGALAGTVGVSVIFTLDANTSMATWVGLELLTAIGIGLALQVPMIANQAAVGVDDVPAATSLSLFMENVGTSLFVAAGETAFTNGLTSSLRHTAPGVNPSLVVNAGVTQLRSSFSSSELPGILAAYLEGCKISHTVSLACGCAATLLSFAIAAPSSLKKMREWAEKVHVT